MAHETFYSDTGGKAIPIRCLRRLDDLCHSLVYLLAILFVCEASTISTTYTAIDRTRREETERRLKPVVQFVSNAIIRNGNEYDLVDAEVTKEPIGLAGYTSDYAGENTTLVPQEGLKYGFSHSFTFQRFQSPKSIRKAFDSVRSVSSFKWFEGKDGRKGYISSTKLGGDYVLAESEQTAVDCTAEDVLRVYLSGKVQARWNAKNCLDCRIKKCRKVEQNQLSPVASSFERGSKLLGRNLLSGRSDSKRQSNEEVTSEDSYFYLQDLLLKSQRVIRGRTGPMRYQQIIEIDKVGQHNYSILVRLFKNKNGSNTENNNRFDGHMDLDGVMVTTAKKPFESLEVYVGLEQLGNDVKIYAAGVFEVNRNVVPKLIVFDTSGVAGSLAGKGTLWLAGYFEKAALKRKHQNPA